MLDCFAFLSVGSFVFLVWSFRYLCSGGCYICLNFEHILIVGPCLDLQGVAINFVKSDDIKILRDIEQYYSTQIDEMPMNVADLI